MLRHQVELTTVLRIFGASILSLVVCGQSCIGQTIVETRAAVPVEKQKAERFSPEARLELIQSSQELNKRIAAEGINQETFALQRKLQEQLSAFILSIKSDGQLAPSLEGDTTEPNDEVGEGTGTQGLPATGIAAGGQSGLPPSGKFQDFDPRSSQSVRETLGNSVWGHLPIRERNELIRSYSDAFPAGYEEQVRRYFEELAKLKHRRLDDNRIKKSD